MRGNRFSRCGAAEAAEIKKQKAKSRIVEVLAALRRLRHFDF
jgi:hypothetical protein